MPGLLSTVVGQPGAVETLRRSVRTGRVHHAYLFDGPDGVGKERAAWGFAQALVCEKRAPNESDACGVCSACVRAIPRPGEATARHPDVTVLERGLYDPVAIGRRAPETQDISVDQVRTLVLAHAAFPPYEGRAKIFLVRRADELSVTAANALLKTLEEPGDRTYFVLLSAAAETLLPTVRSRTQRLRFGLLAEEVLVELLVKGGVTPDRAAAVAPLSRGSMSQALALSDSDASEQRDAFVSAVLSSLKARDLGPALDVAEDAKKMDRQSLLGMLNALALALGAEGRSAAAQPGRRAEVASTRYSLCLAASQEIEANASAQLAVEALLIKMRSL
jgi:DNA polymerase-3 subunit delta'